MKKYKTLKNKLFALLFIFISGIAVLIDYDATFFVVALLIGVPMFFAKEDWFK